MHGLRVGKFKTCSNVGDVAEDIVEWEEISNWAKAGEVVVARVLINIWMKKMTMVVGQWEMTVLLMPMVDSIAVSLFTNSETGR